MSPFQFLRPSKCQILSCLKWVGSPTDYSRMVVSKIRSLSKILKQGLALQVVEFSERGERVSLLIKAQKESKGQYLHIVLTDHATCTDTFSVLLSTLKWKQEWQVTTELNVIKAWNRHWVYKSFQSPKLKWKN